MRTNRTLAAAFGPAIAAVLLATAIAQPASAGDAAKDAAMEDHSQHTAAKVEGGKQLSEGSKALEAVTQKMHKDMAIDFTNDIDVDFVRGMIPHHQGAIEQAEVLLKYSKNPRLRRLAGGIIAAQRREIRFMLKWLNERETGKETGEMPTWMKTAPETVEDAKQSGDKD